LPNWLLPVSFRPVILPDASGTALERQYGNGWSDSVLTGPNSYFAKPEIISLKSL